MAVLWVHKNTPCGMIVKRGGITDSQKGSTAPPDIAKLLSVGGLWIYRWEAWRHNVGAFGEGYVRPFGAEGKALLQNRKCGHNGGPSDVADRDFAVLV